MSGYLGLALLNFYSLIWVVTFNFVLLGNIRSCNRHLCEEQLPAATVCFFAVSGVTSVLLVIKLYRLRKRTFLLEDELHREGQRAILLEANINGTQAWESDVAEQT
jgi:hypothetical protein